MDDLLQAILGMLHDARSNGQQTFTAEEIYDRLHLAGNPVNGTESAIAILALIGRGSIKEVMAFQLTE